MKPLRPLLAYYLGGTPLFFALDAAMGLSVRASFFPAPGARWAYYGFCVFCGVLCWAYPRRAAWVGLGESAVNLTLLMVSFVLPILTITDAVLADPYAPVQAPVTMEGIANFMVAGGMGWWTFQRGTRAIT